MATMTNEQIEQKKQLLAEKVKEMKALVNELVEAGAIEMSEEELNDVTGAGIKDTLFWKLIGRPIASFFTGG